ncbi:MAG: DUF3560 domain-containing protein [Clostridia bacterium]|nr:DUF3560 domain-containing protein [Clostridia bacterium]MBQ3870999.1 DUF3560 domain-containing protein [Clostridia bacterium]
MLSEADKARVKSAFLWSRGGGCWVSRAKEPNLYTAKKIAADLGFGEVEKIGERLTFAEQVERQQERAEARAERYEEHAENAEARAEKLQAGIESHRGDVAFFTQPNINTSAGRSFTNYRNRLYARFEQGFEEYRKSEYWKERAKIAATTAAGEKYQDRAYLDRRIKESKKKLRDYEKAMQAYTNIYERLSAGDIVKMGYSGSDVWTFAKLEERAGDLAERYEAEADKLAFLEDALDALGGIKFSQKNIKPGYIIRLNKNLCGTWLHKVVSTGPVNFQARIADDSFPGAITYAYAEIAEIVEATEEAPKAHPFKVGEAYEVRQWDGREWAKVTAKIIKATDKSVTLQIGDAKPFVRKPSESKYTPGEWILSITDAYDGYVRKRA